MATIPKVKMSQPHVEQIHTHLDIALAQCVKTRAIVTEAGFVEVLPCLDEIEYEVQTARQYLPPRQQKLPF